MGWLWAIIVGFVLGLIAKAIIPGKQHSPLWLVTIFGILGAVARMYVVRAPVATFRVFEFPVVAWIWLGGGLLLLGALISLRRPPRPRTERSRVPVPVPAPQPA